MVIGQWVLLLSYVDWFPKIFQKEELEHVWYS